MPCWKLFRILCTLFNSKSLHQSLLFLLPQSLLFLILTIKNTENRLIFPSFFWFSQLMNCYLSHFLPDWTTPDPSRFSYRSHILGGGLFLLFISKFSPIDLYSSCMDMYVCMLYVAWGLKEIRLLMNMW